MTIVSGLVFLDPSAKLCAHNGPLCDLAAKTSTAAGPHVHGDFFSGLASIYGVGGRNLSLSSQTCTTADPWRLSTKRCNQTDNPTFLLSLGIAYLTPLSHNPTGFVCDHQHVALSFVWNTGAASRHGYFRRELLRGQGQGVRGNTL